LTDRFRHSMSTGSYFYHKSISDSADITQAMKSRGFFIDQNRESRPLI
jgi:hypothetical protein